MTEQQTDARRAAVNHLTTRWTAQALASVIVDALAVAGSADEWDEYTTEQMVAVLQALHLTGVEDVAYWRSVTGPTLNSE